MTRSIHKSQAEMKTFKDVTLVFDLPCKRFPAHSPRFSDAKIVLVSRKRVLSSEETQRKHQTKQVSETL